MPLFENFKQQKNLIFLSLFLSAICALMLISESFMVIAFGICIFLYGISVLELSFSGLSGIETFLKNTTSSKFKSFLFGLISTFIMQSSGLVSVIAISFLSASLITLGAGLAIIYGTNLGTVSTTWLVAGVGLKTQIIYYAMPLIIIGVIMFFNKSKGIKSGGYFLFSIGLLFLGIHYMKSGFDGIKDTIDLAAYAMDGIKGLLVYTLIGIIVTVLMQSSTATLTLTITALSVGQMSYENAIAIAIGSNVGSTVVAVIGSINANSEGKKLMLGHVIFNIASATIMLCFINSIIPITDFVADFLGIDGSDYSLKLAIFHTLFNLIGIVIFYPLTTRLTILLDRLIKPAQIRSKVITAKFLDEKSIQFVDSALIVLVKEMAHLYENTTSIIAKSISISKNDIDSPLSSQEVIEAKNTPMAIDFDELYNNRFKEVYSQIISYLISASANATEKDIAKFMDIRRGALLLAETLKDVKNIQPNVFKFMSSSNEYIKAEYDKLRVKILHILRVIKRIQDFEIDSKSGLKELRRLYDEYESVQFAPDILLNERKISNKMATSLMNDTDIVKEMTRNLLKIIEIISTRSEDEGEFEIIRRNLMSSKQL
ncbi:Na/Pi cotransporter family protein [Campylobacter sp. RM13119]|uniref:Na/Pi cotransporter family protein n=1 Tax=Campylobacter californiensis TaxID=1032243 RepID=UPI001473C4BA|nr:Na/Pi symporter [Campylobacter sp. RM13119]MBE3606165.1 Na/Pi cotransporter family protein [Campylobacter sp. RM13119]